MNKTQQINELKWEVRARGFEIDMLNKSLETESGLVETLVEQADASDRLHKRLMADERARHTAEKKAATEAATLQSIRDGFVPIEVLRNHVRQEYTTTHSPSCTMTDMALMLRGDRAVDKAILAALLEKPNGGYTTPKVGDRVGVYYCGNN